MHKTKWVFRLLIVGGLWGLVSCRDAARDQGRFIVVSSAPLQALVGELLRDIPGWSVRSVSGGHGGCEHDRTLSVEDAKTVCAAALCLFSGESFMQKALRACPQVHCVHVSARYDSVRILSDGDVDPHLWFSPRALAYESDEIFNAMQRLMKKDSALLIRNKGILDSQLMILADSVHALSARIRGKKVAMLHEAYGYLMRDLGVEVAFSWGHEEYAPGAQSLAQWIQHIRRDSVSALVTTPEEAKGNAAVLARETGLPLVALDPLTEIPATDAMRSGFEPWARLYLDNLRQLRVALDRQP